MYESHNEGSIAETFPKRRSIVWLIVIAVVVFRVVSATSFGPIAPPDTAHYVGQAHCLFKTFGAPTAPCPDGAFKAVGYGFLIAGAMVLIGPGWEWGIVAFQIGLSLVASFVLARLMLVLSGSFAMALLTFAMHNLALPLNIDLMLLRDSLFASAITIALGTCAWQALEPRPPIHVSVLLVGLLFAIGSALREQIVYYGIFFLPLVLLWLTRNLGSWRAVALALIIITAPTVLMHFAFKAWNQRMTGLPVVSTNAKTVMSQAVLEVAKKHPDLYDGETPLDKAARRLFVRYVYSEVIDINHYLRGQGVGDAVIAELAIGKYFEAWRRYPTDFLAVVQSRFIKEPSRISFNPAKALLMNKGYAENVLYFDFGDSLLRKSWKKRRIGDFLWAVAERAGRAVSLFLFVSAWASFLISAVRLGAKRPDRVKDGVIVALFIAFFGVTLAHAPIHLEFRQVAGVMWVPLLLGLEFLYRLSGLGRSLEVGRVTA